MLTLNEPEPPEAVQSYAHPRVQRAPVTVKCWVVTGPVSRLRSRRMAWPALAAGAAPGVVVAVTAVVGTALVGVAWGAVVGAVEPRCVALAPAADDDERLAYPIIIPMTSAA